MTMDSIAEMNKFISGLELPKMYALATEGDLPDPTEGNDDKASAYVAGGSIVSFVSGVSQDNQSDVLNSTLLAQLASNKKFDPEKQTRDWYKFYRDVLTKVGWVAQEWNFEEYDFRGSKAGVDSIVLGVLGAIATGNELAIAKQAFDALKSLPKENNKVKLWDEHSNHSGAGNFQIAICSESNNVVATKMGCFSFTSNQTIASVLWFDFSKENSNIYKADQTISLNGDVYEQVREQIVTKLGDLAKTFVADLEI